MGNLMQRSEGGVEEVDIASNNAYKFPPKSGSYFGSHFIMGGVRFDTIQPEAYLFGENADLNFLGNRPIPFPYPAPQAGEPTKTLKSLVNIRKDSLRLVRVSDAEASSVESTGNVSEKSASEQEPDNKRDSNETLTESLASIESIEKDSSDKRTSATDDTKSEDSDVDNSKYNIEFTFDCDVRCAVTVYYFATEEVSNGQILYTPRNASMNSETYHYKKGANQTFSQSSHIIQPGKFSEDEWQYSVDKEEIPVVIHCVVEDEEHIGHSHMTFGYIDKTSDGFSLKPLKQKQMVDGLCYLLQEIYGIENKTSETTKAQQEDEYDDMGSECVICMCDIRDTLILPCRHLCLCNGCADSLRYQANNCPICRSPFRALLQIRAMRKKLPNAPEPDENDENAVSQEGVPTGFEAVSLIEALNGPLAQAQLHGTIEGNRRATSPSASPHVERRRSAKRLSSAGSTSLRGSMVPEELEVTNVESIREEGGDGRGTPEVVMFAQDSEPVKENTENEKRGSKTKKKKPVTGDGDKVAKLPDTIEIVNELEEKSEDDKVDDLELGAEASSEHSHSPDLPQPQPDGGEEEVNLVKPPPAHAGVMYDSKDEQEEREEDDCMVNPLMPDPLSLPGTPITDGSSFNSSCSAKALLPHPYNQSKHQDDHPLV